MNTNVKNDIAEAKIASKVSTEAAHISAQKAAAAAKTVISDKVNDACQAATATAANISDKAAEIKDNIGDRVSDIKEKVSAKAHDARNAVADMLENAAGKLRD